MRRAYIILIIGIIFLAASILTPLARAEDAAPLTKEQLQAQIEQKNQQLNAINQQLQTSQKNLADTQNQKKTLQKELANLQGAINQLDLNIKSDQIASQKLGLEIDSINYDLKDIQSSIEDKKAAINALLLQLQKNDGDSSGLLTVFLKNDTLADGVMETQSITNLRQQLSSDIETFLGLSRDLNGKLAAVNGKKSQIESKQKDLAAQKTIAAQQKEERNTILAQTKNQEARYQQQVNDLKKQQDAISDEIGQIEDKLRASFNVSLLPTKRPGLLGAPLQSMAVTQHYGERSYLYRYKPHNGLDLAAPVGTPVFAADNGVVMAADNNDRSRWQKYQYGKYVLIKHSNDFATLYAHLSLQVVSAGMKVKRGDLIGYSGKTGYATGPHLHFGVYWAPSVILKAIPPAAGLVPVGVTVNPEDYL